ncbi:hypothetical protein SAMN04488079_11274 [Methylophaga sulfidovorans]|uniref:Uncharacterized protein n=2 Tax=Methylophaga sulfidovorans TaxID=45496 RepID=A0A1I3ZYW2_9GAMM|nr:hypothetical protein SAMN04488079_11274 [Methylophaga sulfidovorans]
MHEDIVCKQLEKLVDEINASNSNYKIKFNRQVKQTKNMSLSGANGRLGVQPSSVGYDISLSGKSIQKQMYSFMKELCNKECDGYKQLNTKLGKKDQPYWRVSDFSVVKKAAYNYATTSE